MSTYTDASLIVTPNAKKAGKLYSLKGADLNVVRATTATYVGSDGLIKTALANEVRFDYTNGSCPSILVEPQRTNLLVRSEEFDNGSWGNTNVVVTADATTAPNGTTTADKIVENTANTAHEIRTPLVTFTSGLVYTQSIFAKKAERIYLRVGFSSNVVTGYVIFDLDAGTITYTSTAFVTGSITSVGDGWYRCTVTATSGANIARTNYIGINTNSTTGATYTGDGTSGIYIWGAQLEVGSNATSYIPTVASTVTRNADVISKTGLSGITSITETFENGTTNVISGSPTSYTMSQGRIKHVIGI